MNNNNRLILIRERKLRMFTFELFLKEKAGLGGHERMNGREGCLIERELFLKTDSWLDYL
jgi:hypothetical protein